MSKGFSKQQVLFLIALALTANIAACGPVKFIDIPDSTEAPNESGPNIIFTFPTPVQDSSPFATPHPVSAGSPSASPTMTPVTTATPSATARPPASATPVPSPVVSPTAIPTSTPASIPSATATPISTPTATPVESPSATIPPAPTSPTPTPIPTPTPTPEALCVYNDVTSLTPGMSYTCPQHGSPDDTAFLEVVFATVPVQLYQDAYCTVPEQELIRFSSAQSFDIAGIVPGVAFAGTPQVDMNQTLPCSKYEGGTRGYIEVTNPFYNWYVGSSHCVWKTKLPSCPL